MRYSRFADLQSRFEQLRREHGKCEADGALRTSSALQGSFDLKCERGGIEFDVLLTPALPPLVQALGIRETFTPDEREAGAAAAQVSLACTWSDRDAEQWLAPTLDRKNSRKALARLALEHGACSVEHGTRQGPLGAMNQLRFHLECTNGALDLALKLDESSGKIEFSARIPSPPDAICWP